MSEHKLCQCGIPTDSGTVTVCPMHRTQTMTGTLGMVFPGCTCGPWWGVVPPPPCPYHSAQGAGAYHPNGNPPKCECHECTQARERMRKGIFGE